MSIGPWTPPPTYISDCLPPTASSCLIYQSTLLLLLLLQLLLPDHKLTNSQTVVMSSESLRVLEAEPIDSNYYSDLDLTSPDASTALLQDYSESREETLPPSSSPPRHRHYVRVIALSLVAAIFIEVGDFMERAPMMRLMEDILCRKYYESTAPLGTHITLPIPEQECKIPAVQGELAMLKGWDAALACIPGLLLALPYGYIADRYGRKIVLLLSLIGVTLGLAWILLVGKTSL